MAWHLGKFLDNWSQVLQKRKNFKAPNSFRNLLEMFFYIAAVNYICIFVTLDSTLHPIFPKHISFLFYIKISHIFLCLSADAYFNKKKNLLFPKKTHAKNIFKKCFMSGEKVEPNV